MKPMRFFISLFILSLLTSCGFQLKGYIPTLQNIEIYIENQAPHNPYNPEDNWHILEKALEDNGVVLKNTSQEATHILIISDYKTFREESAIGSSNSREILLSESYHIQLIEEKTGKTNSITVQNSSSMTFNANQYIGNTEELKTAYRHIARENAAHVVRFIEAKTRHE